jgi:hypothetical protein
MSAAERHHCRNPHCRSKLPAPTENEHHAFCTRGCHTSFYRSRCLVCEDPMRRKREDQKLKSGHRTCGAEYRRYPHVYDFPAPRVAISNESLRSADSTGLKSAHEGDRPPFRCLTHWWWGGDPENGDHSLYNQDGLTVARIVLGADGRYHLRTPIARPPMSWSTLNEAKRRAEMIALSALPLDPKLTASIQRNNETAHPMRRKFPAQPERPAAADAAKETAPG